MGYFSNGTEGDRYEEEYCLKCKHGQGEFSDDCPILALHMTYNYDQFKDDILKSILDSFIPRDKDGYNEKCKMFIEVK